MAAGSTARRLSGCLATAVLVSAIWMLTGVASVRAAERSCAEGGLGFGEITGPEVPQEYLCELGIGSQLGLRQIDEQHVEVYYLEDGLVSFVIEAEPAHDAVGATVPTTLRLVGSDVLDLTVHFLAGNPAAGGAPFSFPITEGAGWEGGYRTISVLLEEPAPPPPAASAAQQPSLETTVLGGKEFAPDGEGWGTERPHRIFNGGDPSGLVTHIRWRSWGGPVAIGWGRNPIFKPHGGYYRHPVRIELRASDVGTCEGMRAYLHLRVRVPARPGGKLGPWRSWSGASNVCAAPSG